MTADETLHGLILALEAELMNPITRKTSHRARALLAEDFCEFGSSGRVWNRESILLELGREPERPAPEISGFKIQVLLPEAVLATYRTSWEGRHTLRSSLWIKRYGTWQVLFHQGTPMPGEPTSDQCSDSM